MVRFESCLKKGSHGGLHVLHEASEKKSQHLPFGSLSDFPPLVVRFPFVSWFQPRLSGNSWTVAWMSLSENQ